MSRAACWPPCRACRRRASTSSNRTSRSLAWKRRLAALSPSVQTRGASRSARWSSPVAPGAAHWESSSASTIPVTPLRGQILALGPQSPAPLRHTLYTHGAYLVPRADGRSSPGRPKNGQASRQTRRKRALPACAPMPPALPRSGDWPLHSAWAGLRPVSADGLPLLGRAPGWIMSMSRRDTVERIME